MSNLYVVINYISVEHFLIVCYYNYARVYVTVLCSQNEGTGCKMKLTNCIAVMLVLILLSAYPVSALAQISETEYIATGKGQTELASLSYDIRFLDKYVGDCDRFKEYLTAEVKSFNEMIDVKEYKLPVDEQVIEAIGVILFKEAPELFNIESVSYSYVGDTIHFVNITYLYTPEEYMAMLAECEAIAEEMLADIKATPTLTQAEVALLIHDRLAMICTYDRKMQNVNKFDMYGALVDGLAVCEGYTKSYTYLLSKMGIESEFCASTDLAHAWNIVYIDGVPYHADVTWDDIGVVAGEVYHDNFLLSTEALYKGGSEFFVNAHNATDYNTAPQDTTYDNYFWHDSYTEIQLIDGELYYLNGRNQTICKYNDGDFDVLFKGTDRWNKYWNCYSRLSSDGKDLFYSSNNAVYFLDLETLISSKAYEPEEVQQLDMEIYGFMYEDGFLVCDLSTTNNYFNSDVLRVKQKFERSELSTPAVPSGVSIIGSPVRGYYIVGEELDTTGIELEVVYSDGSVKRVSEDIEILSYDSSKVGKQNVVLSCYGIQIEYEITVCPKGDVNLDGKVTIADVTMLQKFLASLSTFNDLQKKAAEVSGDGNLSINDATSIQKYLAGLIEQL